MGDRDYRTREAAQRELVEIADEVQPQLRATYDAGTGSAEANQRLERLLNRTNATPRNLRNSRAHEVLERMAPPLRMR